LTIPGQIYKKNKKINRQKYLLC